MRRVHRILFLWACLFPVFLAADEAPTISQIAEAGRQEAREALKQLRDFRTKAEKEQLPLEREIASLRNTLREKRKELNQLREARDSRDIALEDLEREVMRMSAAASTAESLLAEILADWSETPVAFSSPEESAEAGAWSASPLPFSDRIDIARALLPRIATDLQDAIGGKIAPATVLTQDGRRAKGTGIFFGPLVYFAGPESGPVDVSNPAFPRLIPSSGQESNEIQETAEKHIGFLPLDPTGGAALALRRTEPGIVGELYKGGIWIYPILIAAAVAAFVSLIKWISISRIRRSIRRGESAFTDLLRKNAKPAEMRDFMGAQRPLLRSFWTTLWQERDNDPDSREDLLFTKIIEIRLRLTRGLAALSVIAATTPLLGLLGTVTGMISTFRRITLFGTGDPQALSGGISEALITTKFGLIVAIPTFLLYAFLSRRAQGTAAELERIKDDTFEKTKK